MVKAGCRRRGATNLGRAVLALLPVCIVAGCVETTASVPPPAVEPHTNLARREGVSPRGASVAMASLSGPPQSIVDRFKDAFGREAPGQEIALVEPKAAKYLVRGYMNAYPTEQGTAVSFVWDVFDAEKHRAQRVDDVVVVKGDAPDPWSLIDDSVLADVVSRSADEIAAFLSNTPEALRAAKVEPKGEPKTRGAAAVAAATPDDRNQTIRQGSPPADPDGAPSPASSRLGVAALR